MGLQAKIENIDKIIKAIKSADGKASYENLRSGVMAEFYVSQRTATEYLKIALYKLNINRCDLLRKDGE